MRTPLAVLCLLLAAAPALAADKPPVYLWLEPEWFDGVKGSFGYWTGEAKPTGSWGVAGPGISPEWTQGGESEWNSMGAPATETKAECGRDLVIPRAGKYRVWVRYVDHRKKTEPFNVIVRQGGKEPVRGELGVKPVVPANDEYQLYWGFSFGWGSLDGDLAAVRLLLRPRAAARRGGAVPKPVRGQEGPADPVLPAPAAGRLPRRLAGPVARFAAAPLAGAHQNALLHHDQLRRRQLHRQDRPG